MTSKVAIIRSQAENALSDVDRVMALGGYREALDPGATTILKDNISWHFPFLSANTTPWQLEGDHPGACARAAIDDLVACRTRPSSPTRSRARTSTAHAALRGLLRARAVQLPRRGHELDALRAQGRDARARQDLPRRHPHPGLLPRQEHRPPADGQVPHLHDDHRRDEERVRRPAQHAPALHPHLDPRDARRPARDPEGDPPRALRGDGRHDRRQRPGPAHDDPGAEGRHARERRPGGDRRGRGQDDGLRPDVDPLHPARARARPGLRRPTQIEIVGDTELAEQNWGFHVGDNAASRVGDGIWFGPLGALQKLFFHTPLVYLFIFGSFAYHDYVWWPLKGKAIQEKVRARPVGAGCSTATSRPRMPLRSGRRRALEAISPSAARASSPTRLV